MFHRNVTRAGIQNLLVRFEAPLAASVASSVNSSDSYNRDVTWCYLHERGEALGHHWEVTQQTEHLEAALATSQTALAAMEGERSVVRAGLAYSDARVTGGILRRNPVPLLFYSVMLSMMILSPLITALMEELEALQLVVNNDARALNVWGDLVVSRL